MGPKGCQEKNAKKLGGKSQAKNAVLFQQTILPLFCAFLAARKGHPPKSRR
jgi:hypothetical protein